MQVAPNHWNFCRAVLECIARVFSAQVSDDVFPAPLVPPPIFSEAAGDFLAFGIAVAFSLSKLARGVDDDRAEALAVFELRLEAIRVRRLPYSGW